MDSVILGASRKEFFNSLLGFNWWVTARGQIIVDNVWNPSPAHDAGLKQGDVILAALNWPLYPWVPDWDRYMQIIGEVFQQSIPGEFLVSLLLDVKYIRMDLREQYFSGPVELLVQREGKKLPSIILYPQHLPAEYAINVVIAIAKSFFR